MTYGLYVKPDFRTLRNVRKDPFWEYYIDLDYKPEDIIDIHLSVLLMYVTCSLMFDEIRGLKVGLHYYSLFCPKS